MALLLLAGGSLYLLLPSLVEVFSSWPELRKLHPLWIVAAACFEAVSFMAVWTLQRIALRSRSWFAVGSSQLSANAAGTIIPGGGAAAGAVQYGMLVRSGVPPAAVASGLTTTMAASTAAVLALPAVALVAAIGGSAMPHKLQHVAYLGGGAFLLFAAAAIAAFLWDGPLLLVGRGIRAAAGWVRQGERVADLPERLLHQRDVIRAAFAAHPVLALLAALGKWGFDFLVLVSVLEALGLQPDPALLLLAYASSMLLGLIPLTPGGLGFVEAGLAGMLVLAGVGGGDAAVATLAYRLVAFWLPLPAGLGAWLLFRHRYSSATTSSPS
ncbi:MAG TPA: flippase-like domain-containing protein [Gaiellaceae bacterium]|nr:flippase-like domain-containing protein [Gaiellaceae bacterium]